MDTETALLWGFLVLFLVVIGTLIALLVHSGLFVPVVVKTCKPDLGEVQIAYKFARGPYKESGALFTEIHSLLPEYRTLGVYYDDPKVKQPQKLRYIVGVIISENGTEVVAEHRQVLEQNGYQFATFPAIDHAVQTTFPFNSTISIIMAVMKVYPALREYIESRSLCARPFIELYDNNRAEIVFIGPLARQDDFYVPEVLQEEEEYRQDDYDDDTRTENSSHSWDESMSFVREEGRGSECLESDGSEREESIKHPSPPPPPSPLSSSHLSSSLSPSPPSSFTTPHPPPPPHPPLLLTSSPEDSKTNTTTTTTTTTTTPPPPSTAPTTTTTPSPLPPPASVVEAPDTVDLDTGSAGSESDANTASSFEEIDEREAASVPSAAAGVGGGGGDGGQREGSARKDDDEGER